MAELCSEGLEGRDLSMPFRHESVEASKVCQVQKGELTGCLLPYYHLCWMAAASESLVNFGLERLITCTKRCFLSSSSLRCQKIDSDVAL